jgi:hypothetical protein
VNLSEDQMDSFYITILSDSSTDMNPGNICSSFYNKLPKRFELYDDYEVALTKVTLPFTLKNMYADRSMAWVSSGNSIYKRSIIAEKYCSDINLVLQQLETDLDKTFTFTVQDRKVLIKNAMKDNSKCLRLSSTLASQLGFMQQDQFLCGNHRAPHVYNLDAGFPNQLFFYTNIIKPQVYGSKFLQIIQSTVFEMKNYIYGSYKEINFSNLQYYPVSVRDFDQIHFNIKDNNGIIAPFSTGSCTGTLHFRKTNY